MPRLIACAALLITTIFPVPAVADVLDNIIKRGTIRVGVAEIAPWTLRDANGELIGFEIDVAKKIAADMRVKADYKLYEWDDLVPALDRGEIDVIASGLTITPAHALQVNFSRPIATSGVSIATNTARTKDIKSLRDLDRKGVAIAVVADTLSANTAKNFFDEADVVAYASADLAEREVVSGRAFAYVASLPEVSFLALRNADAIDVPMNKPLVAASEGLAVKKGEQELLNFLNAWVTAHHSDRWLESTRDYWFQTMDWIQERQK
ncbi:MAG: transporter substrate-binding domain-containing protein [Woeseiaceae bacterium]